MGMKRIIVRALLRPLVVGVLVGGAWQWAGPVAAQEKTAEKEASQTKSQDRIRELKKEKVALLRDVNSILKAAFESGRTSYDRVQAAQKNLLAAELELSETDKERLAILKEMYAVARDAEAAADRRYKSGDLPKNDFLMTTVARIEAEIALEKVKGKMGESSGK